MKKFIKKIIAVLIIGSITLTTSLANADNSFPIYQSTKEEKIANSITHKHIQKFTSDGWLNINVLEVDITDEYTDVLPMFSKDGLPHKDTISTMIKEHGAVAGINGDFYSRFHSSFPLGAMIENGNMIVSPIVTTEKLPVFSIDNNNIPSANFWDWSIKAIPEGKEPVTVYTINKDSQSYEGVIMFDRNWSNESLGNKYYNDLTEVIIENDIVTDIRTGKPPIAIPKNGYVLVGRNYARNVLLSNFKIGDKVELKITTSPNYNDISMAIGSGTFLVKDGKVANFTLNIKGNHPRTAIGTNKNRDKLIMVTVDGRHTSFNGVTQTKLAEIMIELGAYEAVNLDGGGSTTMSVFPKDEEKPSVLNYPSDGSERRVVNGIGIFNNAPLMPLDHIKISTERKNIFINTSIEVNVKGYDKYNNPIPVNAKDLSFRVCGTDGEFLDNIFIPNESGSTLIAADYKGKTAFTTFNVLNTPNSIDAPDEFTIDTNTEISLDKLLGDIKGENNEGYVAKLDIENLEFEINGEIGSIEDNMFTSSSTPSFGAITIKAGQAVKNILVSVGYEEKTVLDFESMDNITCKGYPSNVSASVALSNTSKTGKHSLSLKYDFTKTNETRAAYVMLGENEIEINQTIDKLGMWVYGNNSDHWIRGKIIDKYDNSHVLDFTNHIDFEGWKWIEADVPSFISYPIKLDRIYAVEINPLNKDNGEILFDGIKSIYHSTYDTLVLPAETSLKDPRERHEELSEGGYKFTVFNGIDDLNNLLKYHMINALKEKTTDSNLDICFGNMNQKYTKDLNKPIHNVISGYSSFDNNDTVFVQLDNTNGGLRTTNPLQWRYLINKLKTFDKENMIILMPKPIFGDKGFSDKLEAELLHEKLSEYTSQGKNIWIIHGGSQNKVKLKDGVRYVEIDNTEINTDTNILDLKYFVFTVNGDNITYEILPMFKH